MYVRIKQTKRNKLKGGNSNSNSNKTISYNNLLNSSYININVNPSTNLTDNIIDAMNYVKQYEMKFICLHSMKDEICSLFDTFIKLINKQTSIQDILYINYQFKYQLQDLFKSIINNSKCWIFIRPGSNLRENNLYVQEMQFRDYFWDYLVASIQLTELEWLDSHKYI